MLTLANGLYQRISSGVAAMQHQLLRQDVLI